MRFNWARMRLSMGQPPQVGWGGLDKQAQETSKFQEIQPWEGCGGLASLNVQFATGKLAK